MTTRKYNSDEERNAARRARELERRAIMQALVRQHRQDALKRAQTVPAATPDVYKRNAVMLQNATIRSSVIRVLLDQHYDELKAELDAYRLINK